MLPLGWCGPAEKEGVDHVSLSPGLPPEALHTPRQPRPLRARHARATPAPEIAVGMRERMFRVEIIQDAFCQRRPRPERLFRKPSGHRDRYSWCDLEASRYPTCAVKRRRFSSGCKAHPASLQPEATGAGMEVTKCLKPPDSGHEFGDRASAQAAT